MDDTAKYLIHAEVVADGVVERSDVVGAVYGQTEGLLGDDLDLRALQRARKVGRIDVAVESRDGRSHADLTIASRLDKVETAIVAAALETIDRVGPCEATVEVPRIEDVRQAKRREVVDRAKELLASAFDDELMSSAELIEEVRESVRTDRITEYEGLPAGPRVADSDAVIVVEGRADVGTLLEYGVKNAIAVEGTNVPDAVADLTRERTVTAFLDGDRGGDLILRELDQVGEIDHVAFAPEDRSVEDLDRHEVLAALRDKVPFEMVLDDAAEDATAATDGSVQPAPDRTTPVDDGPDAGEAADDAPEPEGTADEESEAAEPETLRGHVDAAMGTGTVRLLDAAFDLLEAAPAEDAFDAIEAADEVPAAVVLDGIVTQRILDVAAQRGVGQVVARELGDFTKQPASVRVRTVDAITGDAA